VKNIYIIIIIITSGYVLRRDIRGDSVVWGVEFTSKIGKNLAIHLSTDKQGVSGLQI